MMPKKDKLKEFMKDKGFYLVLALCIVGASTAAWITANNTLESIENQNQELTSQISSKEDIQWEENPVPENSSSVVEVGETLKDVEKSSSSSISQPVPSSSSSSTENLKKDYDSSQTAQKLEQSPYTLPMEFLAVIHPFSDGQPVKNKTLNVWRAHNSVDFKGEMGCKIMAVSDGVVTAMGTDPLWGNYLEITHPDGYVSSYHGTKAESSLKKGDNVTGGQKIGELSDIPAEAYIGPHLHFTLKKDNDSVDPGKLLKLK